MIAISNQTSQTIKNETRIVNNLFSFLIFVQHTGVPSIIYTQHIVGAKKDFAKRQIIFSNFWVLIGCGKFICFIKHRLKCEAKSFASPPSLPLRVYSSIIGIRCPKIGCVTKNQNPKNGCVEVSLDGPPGFGYIV